MDSGDKDQDGNNISPIMTLPEEAMREIFNNLSFQTLYFSLRTVCKNIKTYVDRYLKSRKTYFFFGCKKGSEKEVIEISELPANGYFILRMPASSIPWVTRILQNSKILDKHVYTLLFRAHHAANHAANQTKNACHIYKSEISLTFRNDQGCDIWEKLLETCTTTHTISQMKNHYKTSHESIQRLVSEIIPYHCEFFNYAFGHYPFVQVKAKDKTWSVGIIISCKRL